MGQSVHSLLSPQIKDTTSSEESQEGTTTRYSDHVPIVTLFSGGDTFASALNGVVHTQFAAENRPEITAVYQANHDGFVFDDVLKMKPEEMPDI